MATFAVGLLIALLGPQDLLVLEVDADKLEGVVHVILASEFGALGKQILVLSLGLLLELLVPADGNHKVPLLTPCIGILCQGKFKLR